jgi:hypothetical protein
MSSYYDERSLAHYSNDGIITFAGREYLPKEKDKNYRLQTGQYFDYGDPFFGYGAKVMIKYYTNEGLITWIDNRHIPIAFQIMKDGKCISYNHGSRYVMASSRDKINGHPFTPLELQMGVGHFVILETRCEKLFEKLKDWFENETIVFVDNCAIPVSILWEHFDLCWESVIAGNKFNWMECVKRVQLPFDFSTKNRKLLYNIIGEQKHVWLSANRIRLEQENIMLSGTGPEFPWL